MSERTRSSNCRAVAYVSVVTNRRVTQPVWFMLHELGVRSSKGDALQSQQMNTPELALCESMSAVWTPAINRFEKVCKEYTTAHVMDKTGLVRTISRIGKSLPLYPAVAPQKRSSRETPHSSFREVCLEYCRRP
jgi:hypothetical protein